MILSKVVIRTILLGSLISWSASGVRGDQRTAEEGPLEPVYQSYDRPIEPDLYLIRPGEQLSITFVQSQLSPLGLRVSQDGKVAHAAIGLFDLTGKTLTQSRALLLGPIAKVFNAQDIEISVGVPYRVTISISGAVAKPGYYRAYTAQRVSDLIEAAGGLTPEASTRRITFSGGLKTLLVDLDRAVELGDYTANPCLYAGYHINVPRRSGDLIQVIGAVHHARNIELLPADDLQKLLAIAGGALDEADTSSIKIIGDPSRNPGEPGGIRAGDVILVPWRPEGPEAAMLAMVGEVGKPGWYSYSDNITLGRLIFEAGGLTARANAGRVTVFRKAEADAWGNAPRERYPVRVMESSPEQSSMPLMPGDSVLVSALVGYVKVSGLVRRPGMYPYTIDKSATYYIGLAGGESSKAVRKELTLFDRASRTSYDIERTTRISDGDEITVSAVETTP